MKIPKQLRHWAQLSGLKPESNRLRNRNLHYYVGHGRHWRLTDIFEWQMSDIDAEFDRWANVQRTACHYL